MLKVILAYLIALVPLNWLICRFVLSRREWAWVVVPLLSLGLRDRRRAGRRLRHGLRLGLRRDRPARGPRRLSRGPPQPVRLALHDRPRQVHDLVPERPDRAGPAARQRPVDPRRGRDDLGLAVVPGPGAAGLQVQPRSLSHVPRRADVTPGRRDPAGGRRGGRDGSSTAATSSCATRCCRHRRPASERQRDRTWGRSPPGASVEVGRGGPRGAGRDGRRGPTGPTPSRSSAELRTTWENRPENRGEIRLVAWVAAADPGPGDRAGGRPASRVHGGARPPPQRPAAQPRRPALQPAGRSARRSRPGYDRAIRDRPHPRRRGTPDNAGPSRPRAPQAARRPRSAVVDRFGRGGQTEMHDR